jgi:gluconolactonase
MAMKNEGALGTSHLRFIGSVALVVLCAILSFALFGVRAEAPRRAFVLKAASPRFWRLLDHTAKLEVLESGFGFTEGPVWDPAGFVYVSDEETNKIYRVYADGSKQEFLSLGDPDGNTYDAQHRLVDCASLLRGNYSNRQAWKVPNSGQSL